MSAGRPTDYSDDVLTEARAYLTGFKELHDHAIPSAVGLAKVLGIARSTLYLWAEEHEEFSDILSMLKSNQELELLNKGLTGDFNSTIAKLILTKHDYSDKAQQELSGPEGKPIEVDQEFRVSVVDP